MFSGTALADSSSSKLAAYYYRQMAIVAGKVYAWEGEDQPTILPIAACQVDVGRDEYYALTNNGELPVFDYVAEQPAVLIRDIARFVAGDSGVLTITSARALWWLTGETRQLLSTDVADAAVGDGANYCITTSGDLFVKGRAHREQYGDGRLKTTDQFLLTLPTPHT